MAVGGFLVRLSPEDVGLSGKDVRLRGNVVIVCGKVVEKGTTRSG